MNTLLDYQLAVERIAEQHKQAELYRLIGQKASFRNQVANILHTFATRLEPKPKRQTSL
jgi:hypothetical protein